MASISKHNVYSTKCLRNKKIIKFLQESSNDIKENKFIDKSKQHKVCTNKKLLKSTLFNNISAHNCSLKNNLQVNKKIEKNSNEKSNVLNVSSMGNLLGVSCSTPKTIKQKKLKKKKQRLARNILSNLKLNKKICLKSCGKFESTEKSSAKQTIESELSKTNESLEDDENLLVQKDRRKFYIVQNSGSPAEMYCTDLVHKAKHGTNRLRNFDESRMMKCTDKWREEWNHGVQMPLSRKRPTYCLKQINLFPNLKQENFLLPNKYIALNETRYTKNFLSNFKICEKVPLYQYEINSSDEEWLSSPEAHGIKHLDFLKIMNRFEIDCYKDIHLILLKKLTFALENEKNDDDAACDICCMPEWELGDEIVFCDICNVSVHQSCYGLESVPTNEWMCATCKYKNEFLKTEESFLPSCIFCPLLGGAMKSTKNGDTWAHIVCALWIPEVRFADIERREPITYINDVPASRWQIKCVLCDTSNGACINCTFSDCNIPFHVSCAQRAGLTLQIEQDINAKNGVRMISYCLKHSFVNNSNSQNSSSLITERRNNHSTFDRNLLHDMKQNFFKHVDYTKIADDCSVDIKIAKVIFNYWCQKRKLNNCQSLLVRPLDIKLSVKPKKIPLSLMLKNKINSHNLMPSKESLKAYEKIRSIRLNLEKARNLCYMVSRREKLKKAHFETFEKACFTIGSLLFDSIVPISKRRTEKLLEIWDFTTNEMLVTQNSSNHLKKPKISSNLTFILKNEEAPKLNEINKFTYKKAKFLSNPTGAKLINESYNLRNNYNLQHEKQKEQNLKTLSLPTSINHNSVYLNQKIDKIFKNAIEERKRRENTFEFRSSTSPTLKEEKESNDGNISDVTNFTEYSVSWSTTSEINRNIYEVENVIPSFKSSKTKKRKRKFKEKEILINTKSKKKKKISLIYLLFI